MTDNAIKEHLIALIPQLEQMRNTLDAMFDKAEDSKLRESTNEAFFRTESLLEFIKFITEQNSTH